MERGCILKIVIVKGGTKVIILGGLSFNTPHFSEKKTRPFPTPHFTAPFTNMRTLKFKSCLHNCVFTAVNDNYDHKQRTLKHKTDQNPPIANHRPWPIGRVDVQFCFLRLRSVKMIDGSEKRNHQLAFELQSSHVCEKRSNYIYLSRTTTENYWKAYLKQRILFFITIFRRAIPASRNIFIKNNIRCFKSAFH